VDRETPQEAATWVLMGDILFDVQVLHARGAHEVGNPCERRAPDHERFPGKVVSEPAWQRPDQAVVPHPRFPRRVWPRFGPKFKWISRINCYAVYTWNLAASTPFSKKFLHPGRGVCSGFVPFVGGSVVKSSHCNIGAFAACKIFYK